MIRLVGWCEGQRARLTKIRKARVERGRDPLAPVTLDGFALPCSDSQEFEVFAAVVGARNAEAFRARVYRYVATRAAQTGEILVARGQFGPIVLSRAGDLVTRQLGEKVYDALVESGLVEPLRGRRGGGTCGATSAATATPLSQATEKDSSPGIPSPAKEASPGTAGFEGGGAAASEALPGSPKRERAQPPRARTGTVGDAERARLDAEGPVVRALNEAALVGGDVGAAAQKLVRELPRRPDWRQRAEAVIAAAAATVSGEPHDGAAAEPLDEVPAGAGVDSTAGKNGRGPR